MSSILLWIDSHMDLNPSLNLEEFGSERRLFVAGVCKLPHQQWRCLGGSGPAYFFRSWFRPSGKLIRPTSKDIIQYWCPDYAKIYFSLWRFVELSSKLWCLVRVLMFKPPEIGVLTFAGSAITHRGWSCCPGRYNFRGWIGADWW